jgi:hypothetical protein
MNAQRDRQWTRRQFLGAAGIAAGGVLLPPPLWLPGARTTGDSGFAAGRALRAAMHVHGSWSEGLGSWEAQFALAAANGFDLLYLTDHDHKAMAMDYMASLSGVPMVSSSTGSFAQKAATASYGALRLLSESSSTTQSASVTLAVQPSPAAASRLRTSIAGLTITQTLTSAALTNGARYEVVVPLSYHPVAGGRAAGQYKLVYRFGVARGRWTEGGGLTGVVGAPTPAAGSVQVLSPETDAAALWPDMLAIDNVAYGLSFVARSPKRTAVADISVRSVTFRRTGNTAAAVIGNQARVVQAYQPRYPGLAAHAATEISENSPHLIPFGIPPWLPDYASLSTSHDTRYRQLVAQVHGMGGTVAWNHPFGSTTGPLLSATERVAKRRKVFSSMRTVDVFGADILEVAFALRGQVDAATHLALWDTFSRTGRFLTGNGTSDDHSGKGWRSLDNGFATGLWAASSNDGDVVRALAAGRAFAAHVGRWPGGEMDVLVDGTVPMGAVSVSSRTSRQLAISAANLPAGSTVQLVAGPVDYSGQVDPGTWIVTTLPASAFAAGPCTVQVDTSSSRFYRAQIIASDGGLVGTANPVWLLRQAPPAGVPPARAA